MIESIESIEKIEKMMKVRLKIDEYVTLREGGQ